MIIRSKSSFPGVVGLDPDAITLIAAMTTAPDAARQQLISDHIVALKAAGVWALLDIYYIMAAHHEQASRLNWKNPAAFTLEANGGITFTTDRGWQGNGSTGYLNTGWIPSVNGVNYALDDASLWVYSRSDLTTGAQDMSANGPSGGVTWVRLRNANGIGFARVNQSTTAGHQAEATVSDSLRLFVSRRIGTQIEVIKDGVPGAENTSSATILTPVSIPIAARNNNGTYVDFSPRQYASAGAGAAMSESQHAALYDAQQNGILAAVGAAV
jgi:hypothetical protein